MRTHAIAARLCGGILAAGLTWGTALAQNNPGGPPDQAGTANNIPGRTGTPGTFNADTGSASSSKARPDGSNTASSPPLPGGIGTPSAAAPGAPGTTAPATAPSR